MKFYSNFSLKSYNTFHIDASAKYYYEVESLDELKLQLEEINKTNSKFLILGSGSNVLFTTNYDGSIIHYNPNRITELRNDGTYIFIRAEAGLIWDDLVKYAISKNYCGIENLSMIPGTVGAAPIQNIGAYGVELKDIFHSLSCIDVDTLEEKIFRPDECKFGYRSSVFKNVLKSKVVITNVTLKLKLQPEVNINYSSLKEILGKYPSNELTPAAVSAAVRQIRSSKLPDTTTLGNAGSFFKNPEIDPELFEELSARYQDLVSYKLNNKYKIAAAWLIENCGLKGKRIKNVGTFQNQALVIVNYGGATGKEILDFALYIEEQVFNKFKIKLEPEVNLI